MVRPQLLSNASYSEMEITKPNTRILQQSTRAGLIIWPV